jgi:glutamyl-tRNA synthetase
MLYPCFESDEELKAKQEFRRKRGQSTIYDRAMLKLTSKQRHDAEAGGKRPYWRFKLSGRNLEWRDMVLGARSAALTAVSDPVLVLADGSPSPLLASCVDDIDNRITHVIRGEDAVGNIAIQIELLQTLAGNAAAIRFAHLPALTETAKSAERGQSIGGLPVRNLRNDGIEPLAIIACLVGKTGGTPLPLSELAPNFRLSDLAAGNFDATRLLSTNRRLLRALDFDTVADRLPDGATEAFWLAVRANLDLLKEARGWWDVVAGSIIPPIIEGERDLLLLAGSLLPPEPWDAAVWKGWTTALENATRRTGEALLTPLRLALTGEESGPDLADLLPLIGRSRALDRLQIAAA